MCYTFLFMIVLFLFPTTYSSDLCVYKLRKGKLVPSKGCTLSDGKIIVSELKARIKNKDTQSKVEETAAVMTTIDTVDTGSVTDTVTSSTNSILNETNTTPPTTVLYLNQTTAMEHEVSTKASSTSSAEDTHIILGRRSSLALLSIIGNARIIYQPYDINVTNLIVVDYDPVDEYIYWTEQTYIRRAKATYTAGEILVANLTTEIDGIAIDWVARNMYWTDKGRKVLEVSRLDGSSRKVLINSTIDSPRAIALNPGAGMMYWSDWGTNPKIEANSLDGSMRRIVVNESLMWPNGLVIDYPRQFLYWVDSALDRIEVIRLDGSGRQMLLAHDHHIFGFTYLNDFIYWTDWQTGSLDRVWVYNTSLRQNIASGVGDFMGIKAYGNNPIPQSNECARNNNGCSHLCLYTPDGGICECPQNWSLNPDGKTCTSM